jgi:predicted alpha/beta-hydrolase family hydrolase
LKHSELLVDVETGAKTTALVYAADRPASSALILGHGAGAGQHSRFIVDFARALATLGLDAITFNFLYTEQHRRIPDALPKLQACFRAVIAAAREHGARGRRSLFIGGKSMGGRVATHVAADDKGLLIAGVVLLGYPLHPPGRPQQLRDAHLPAVGRPMLFVQGSRDAFGVPSELKPILGKISPPPTLHVVEGGDHSFKLPGRDAARQTAIDGDVQRVIAEWIATVDRRS